MEAYGEGITQAVCGAWTDPPAHRPEGGEAGVRKKILRFFPLRPPESPKGLIYRHRAESKGDPTPEGTRPVIAESVRRHIVLKAERRESEKNLEIFFA